MALRLVRRGSWRVPVTVPPGSGWVNAVTAGSTPNPYVVETSQVAVTATGCDGVRIIDWDNNRDLYAEGVSSGGMHTCTAHVLGGRGVVRILNPTDKTEVVVTSIPIPPLLNSRILTALVRWLPWR